MIDRNKELLPQMQASFPHLYDVYNEKTILYALLSVYADRAKSRLRIIDRLYAMIGIDSTYDEDLEYRWGSLLGIKRNSGESYSDYRARLLIIYASLAGGTAEAIKYAIASTIDISSSQDEINRYIKVYDAWEYPEVPDTSLTNKDNVFLNQNFVTNTEIISTDYGHIICTVDLEANESITTMYDKIMTAIKKTKASGIYPYLLLIYITNEIAIIKYNEYLHDKLIDGFSDISFIASCKDTYYPELNHISKLNKDFKTNKEWHVDNVDDWHDTVKFSTVVEIGLLTSVKSGTWSWDIGKTNDDMITNKYVDTDWKYDIIRSLVSEDTSISIDEVSNFGINELNDEQHIIIGNKTDYYPLLNNMLITTNNNMKLNNEYIFDGGDKFLDSMKHTIHETKAVCSSMTTTWSYLGTNIAILNDSLVTNMFAESDTCIDVIRHLTYNELIGIISDDIMNSTSYEERDDIAFIASCKDTYHPELNCQCKLNIDFITNSEWHVDNVDDIIDKSVEIIQETKAIHSDITTTWSCFGTNIAILNDNMITNIFVESDVCDDVIKYI